MGEDGVTTGHALWAAEELEFGSLGVEQPHVGFEQETVQLETTRPLL